MAALPHIIQLRGPWEVRDSATNSAGAASTPIFVEFAERNQPRAIEVRRSFQWVAEPHPQEQIFLVLDAWRGCPEVRLNGRRIEPQSDEVPQRFDVSRLLRPRNDLAVSFVFPPGAADGSAVSAAPLFRSPPHLSIESARARVAYVAVELHEPDAAESLVLEATIEASGGLTSDIELHVELGDAHQTVPVALRAQGRSAVRVSMPSVALAPWRPRWLGPPVLHPLRFRLTERSTVLHEQTWLVGLRDAEIRVGSDGGLRVRCGGSEAPLVYSPYTAEQLFRPNLGNSAGVAVEDWEVVQGNALDLRAAAASDEAYECLDRIGLFWLAPPEAPGGTNRYWKRFGRHPSMLPV